MPRLTWDPASAKEVDDARAAFVIYGRRRFIAKHKGTVVRVFDRHSSPLDFEPMPTSFDRVNKETDPWEP